MMITIEKQSPVVSKEQTFLNLFIQSLSVEKNLLLINLKFYLRFIDEENLVLEEPLY